MIKAISSYNKITTASDLRRHKISKTDYDTIYYILKDMANGKAVTTISENVANWFKRNGCTLKEIECGWQIIY